MQPIRRAIHIDFHTMPGIFDFATEIDPHKTAQILKQAEVTHVNLFAQCNLGFAYYPTKLGTQYPQLKGDLFGELNTACRNVGLNTVAYLNAGVNHELARKHADWCRVDEEGRIIHGDRTDNFSRTMCYNSAGYLSHMLGIINEILQYEIDGFFIDCMFPMPCYCDRCTEEMLKTGIDIKDYAAVSDFAFEKTVSFAKQLRAAIPEHYSFYVNGLPFDVLSETNTHIELECLPGSAWGYDYFLPMAAYARKLNPDVTYMTGRFQMGWGDFGGYKTRASMENDIYDALCRGCAVSIGDHMHPATGLSQRLYNTIGELYRKVKQYEAWTDKTENVADIAILKNKASSRYSILTGSIQGAARMLAELKYTFDIINEEMDFSQYRVVVLADELSVSEQTRQKLAKFIASGGAILASGDAILDEKGEQICLPEFNFIRTDGKRDKTAYFKRTNEENTPYLGMYEPAIRMYAQDDAEVIAEQVAAYFDRHWDGIHGYFYTPPKRESTSCAASIRKNLAYVSFPVFHAYFLYAYIEQKNLVSDILKRLLPQPLLSASQLPSTARVSLSHGNGYRLLHIKLTHPEPRGSACAIEEHSILPQGKKISVRGKFSNAVILPEKTALSVALSSDYTEITLPQITGYIMIMLT